jgi:hypothetical protein
MLRRSVRLALLVGLVAGVLPSSTAAATLRHVDEPSVFVCYSISSPPAVMPLSTAVALGERPAVAAAEVARDAGAYWQPFAVDPTVAAQLDLVTELGGFYLSCNPFALWPTGSAVGGSGELYDAAVATAYAGSESEALGVYPVGGWALRRIGPPVCGFGCGGSGIPTDHLGAGERLSLRSWHAVRRGTSVTETVRFVLCTTRTHGPFSVSVYEAYGPVSLAETVDRTVQFQLRAHNARLRQPICRTVRYRWNRSPRLRGHGDRELLVTVVYPLDAPAPVEPVDGRPFRLAAEATVRS